MDLENKTNFMITLETKGNEIITKPNLKQKRARLTDLQFADRLTAGSHNAAHRIKYWGRMGAYGGGICGLFCGSAFVFVSRGGPLLTTAPLVAWILLGLAGAMVGGGLAAFGAGIHNLGIAHDRILRSEAAFSLVEFAITANDSTQPAILARNLIKRSTAKALEEDPALRASRNIKRWEHGLRP